MLNAMTVDVEDWYMTNGFDFAPDTWHRFEDRIVGSNARVLELLGNYDVKATFFVLGCVAERHPEIVEAIAGAGHEIGTHGGWHKMLSAMEPGEIIEDILYSKEVLERVSGQKVRMFRAPSWSITPRTYPVLKQLEQAGFVLDSSIQPFQTPLSGVGGAPLHPFHPIVDGERLSLVEFPSTVLSFGGLRIPFSGGFYLRALPYWFVRGALRRINAAAPGMVYIHPWEFDPRQPRLPVGPLIRLAQYCNLDRTERKLERLLGEFSFGPLRQVMELHRFPDVTLDAGRGAGAPAGPDGAR